MNHSRVDLKVCEACGALWLRADCPAVLGEGIRPALHNVYCKSCVRMLASFPAPRGPKKASRIRVRIRTRNSSLATAQAGAR